MTDQSGGKGNWREVAASREFVFALLFCAALFVFEWIQFRPLDAIRIFNRHWAEGNQLRLAVFLLLSMFGIGLSVLFFWAAFTSSYLIRFFYVAVFALTAAIEYSMFRAFDRFSRLVDVDTALLGIDLRIGSEAIAMYFNWIAVIPAAAFCILLIFAGKNKSRGIGTFALIVTAFIGFFFVTTYFTKNLFYTNSLANTFRTVVSFPVGWYVGTVDGPAEGMAYGAKREAVTYQAPQPPKNNIVFIVDESIRGDRLSLNGYRVPTTPTLDALNKTGAIANWGVAVSGTTCSHTSNPLMLTGLTELPDRMHNVYRIPTIFQYAKASGYKTSYYDGQTNVIWNGKTLDIPDFGDWIKVNELSKNTNFRYEIDAEIARRLKETLATSTGNFIWVNKFGVHTPYTNSFPNEHYGEILDALPADYDPYLQEDAIGKLYDAAITYNLESFFRELLADGPAADTYYVYTSDHGQTLRENGSTVSHCAETKPEANVPLFMIAEKEHLPPADTSYRPTQANIFATLLDLMQFPESERKQPYALSLLKASGKDSAPRFYYSNELRLAVKHPFD